MKANSKKVLFPKPRKPLHPGIPAPEWLRDISGRCARVTAVGNRLLVENHTGIAAFSEEHVLLCTACGPLSIEGERLWLSEVRRDVLIVEGCVRTIGLPGPGGAR